MKPEKERILLVLWVSGRCNLRCEYCYADGSPSKKDMDREVMLKTLDSFQDYPLKVQFAGGEPMMNFPLIRETCERARSMEMDVSFQMQTNASLIGERQASEIRRLNIAVGVSLDGIPQVNEKVRGKTAQVVRGIQALRAAGVCVNINSVVTVRNVERLPELVDFSMYLGNVGGIGLDLLRCSGRGISSYRELQVSGRAVQEALEGMYRRSEELYRLTGKRIALREVEEAVMRLKTLENPRGYCYASCGRSYVILPDGSVYPCGSLAGNPDFFMGRIGDRLKKIRLKHSVNMECAQCAYESICPGGCPSRMLLNGFDREGTGLDCALKKTAFNLAKERLKG